MFANKQIKLIVVLAVSVLIGAYMLFQIRKRIERAAEGVQRSSGSITNAIEKTQESSLSSNAAPTMVDTPTAVKSASVAMVPPPVREEVDATAKPKTLPRGDDYKAMLGKIWGLSPKSPPLILLKS